jgi:hypothetical protein
LFGQQGPAQNFEDKGLTTVIDRSPHAASAR